VELADVLVVAVDSCLCAHAPKLNAPANTAMIMIALRNFNLLRLLSPLVASPL
jgi:hypothetical protein